jgi:modulator of FtsH protease HflK
MFLETMERVLGGADKVLIDQNAQGGQGVVPFLPLNDLQRRAPPQAGASPSTGQAQGSNR